MVYAFCTGLFVGLPIGCYLRERGFANKFKSAYHLFSPQTANQELDKLQSKSGEFFQDLKKGQVENKDFERYIYGGNYNERLVDQKDEMDAQIKQTLKDFKQ